MMAFRDMWQLVIVVRMPADSTAVMDLSIIPAARWQHGAIDHTSSMNDAIFRAGTDSQFARTASLKSSIALRILDALDGDTANVKSERLTMVPSVLIALRGKNEIF